METTWLKFRIFLMHLFVDKDFEALAEALLTVRALVVVSPGKTLRYEESKTTASNHLFL